jgi:hypothetical protein
MDRDLYSLGEILARHASASLLEIASLLKGSGHHENLASDAIRLHNEVTELAQRIGRTAALDG